MNIERVAAADLFKTEEFRDSWWIDDLCLKVGVWVTDQVMPPGHFGTYFGATQRRSYDNPYVSDLYWLHELTHVRTLKYDAGRSWLQWSRDMIASELEASLVSECWAYVHIPNLRSKTFKHEIWIDRFLSSDDDTYGGHFSFEAWVRTERMRALHAPAFNDFLEAQLANYYRQNHEWCRIWAESAKTRAEPDKPAFRIVEEHMSASDRDVTHQAWISSHTQRGDWNVPFLMQGKAFTEIYKASNAKFGNWLLTR
jgi:hypothetical protein